MSIDDCSEDIFKSDFIPKEILQQEEDYEEVYSWFIFHHLYQYHRSANDRSNMKNMLWNKHLRNINNSELKYFFFNHFHFNRCKEWERTSTCIPSNNFWANGMLPIWMLLTKNKMLIGILLFLFNNLLVIKKQAKLIDLNMAPIWFNWSLRRSPSSLFMRSFNSSFVIRWVSRLWWLLSALEKPFVYVSTRSCYSVGWNTSQTRIRFIDENKEEENENHKNDDYKGYCKHQCYSRISQEQQVIAIESELVSWFCLQGGCCSITSIGKILFHWHSRFCIFFLFLRSILHQMVPAFIHYYKYDPANKVKRGMFRFHELVFILWIKRSFL